MKTKKLLLTIFVICFVSCLAVLVLSSCALLNPTEHKHKATHVQEVPATCTTAGNIEYWYCSDCGKYFSDSALTVEITLTDTVISAINHANVVKAYEVAPTCTSTGNIKYWYCSDCNKYFADSKLTTELTQDEVSIPATNHEHAAKTGAVPATCTTAGNIEYWYCSDCNKYFADSAYTNEISQSKTVINAINHANAVKTNAVAATCVATGNIEYWYCSDCNKYFADKAFTQEKTQAQLVTAIDSNNHTDVSHTSAKAATCVATGNIEYWYCNGCEKYFADSAYTQEKTQAQTVTAIDENNHLYVDYEYVYATDGVVAHYESQCNRDNTHEKGTQVAGVEGYPYLVRSAEELTYAVGEGGYIKLEEDLTLSAAVSMRQAVSIDLNEKTVTGSAAQVFLAYVDVEISNGKIVNVSTGNQYGIYVLTGASAKLVNCEMEINGTNGRAVHIYNAQNGLSATATLIDCNITCKYAGVYATQPANIILNNTNITSENFGLYASVASVSMSITGGTINAVKGVYTFGSFELNGGTITTTDYAIRIMSPFTGKTYDEFTDDAYTTVSIVGSHITSSGSRGIELQITNATITDTTITAETICVLAYRDTTLVMSGCTLIGNGELGVGLQGQGTTKLTDDSCGNNTDITLNNCNITATLGVYLPQIDSEFTMNGGSITASLTGIEIRAGKATLKNVQITSTAEKFGYAPDQSKWGSGSTILGAAVAVSQHTTNDDIEVTIEGCTLVGCYAFYEVDLMDENSDNITVTFVVENTLEGGVYSQNCDNITAVEPTAPETGDNGQTEGQDQSQGQAD